MKTRLHFELGKVNYAVVDERHEEPRRDRVQMYMVDDEMGEGEETEEGAETYVGTSELPAAGGSHMETLRLLQEMKAEMKDMKAEMKASKADVDLVVRPAGGSFA